MPKITNDKVLEVLRHEYFDHHAAMHLARERLKLPGKPPEKLILPPHHTCRDCGDMIEAGKEGSGAQFLQMHHEMLRVFRFLLERKGLWFLGNSESGDSWTYGDKPSDESYKPVLWDLDDHRKLPQEIIGMLNVTDENFLEQVYDGVRDKVGADYGAKFNSHGAQFAKAVDELGRFIERGVDLNADRDGKPDGSGFHNTLHDYLASREGKASQGAEMNNLRRSMFNDYFWSLHLWIDGQFARLHKKHGRPFLTSGLDPSKLEMFTHKDRHGKTTGMSMAS